MTIRLGLGLCLAIAMTAGAAATMGCSSSSDAAPIVIGATGGSGGSVADGAAGGDSDKPGDSSTGGTKEGGSDAQDKDATTIDDAATDAAEEEAASASPCQANVAFWAVGMSFKYPTPQQLAVQLGALTYDPAIHPITLVLEAVKAPIYAKGAASATDDNGSFSQIFPAGKVPEIVDITLTGDAFTSVGKQNTGYLRVKDDSGPVYIKLTALEFSATTLSSCSVASVTMNGRIPSDQASVSLKISGQTKTLGEIAGPSDDAGSDGWAVSATFQGEATKFDFSTFPTQ